jgi:hypothetical protein
MMRGWLKKCNDEHKVCPPSEEHELPTRVLNVGRATGQPYLMASNGRQGKWAALSHCWGGLLELKTTTKNIKHYYEKNGLYFEELPPTFQDAVSVARGLGIDYLWIDALCIIQDDREDWNREAERMGYIYKYATITIAAEASPTSGIGILNSMKVSRQSSTKLAAVSCHSIRHGVQGKIYFRKNHLRSSGSEWTYRGSLSTRAWTMQEELLSSRILRFSETQVIWHCSGANWSEWSPYSNNVVLWDFSQGLHKAISNLPALDTDYVMPMSPQQTEQLLRFWYLDVVNYYAGRDVTCRTDKLIAVGGVAKEILARLEEYDYIAGIFYSVLDQTCADVHKALSWHVPASHAGTNRLPYVAPSWSWANVDFAFNTSTIIRHRFIYDLKLLSDMTPLAENIKFSTITTLADSSLLPKNTARHLLSIQGESLEICSCLIPEVFFDRKSSSSEQEHHYRFDRISSRRDQFLPSIGLQALHNRKCHLMNTGEHKRYIYLQLARWEPHRYIRKGLLLPVIIALILEEVGSNLEPRHRRVGRALIPTEPSDDIHWAIESFDII